MSFTKQERKWYIITYFFFRIEVKPPENMPESIHT